MKPQPNIPPSSRNRNLILGLSLLKSCFNILSTYYIHRITSYYLLQSTLNRRKNHVLKYLILLGAFGLVNVVGKGILDLIFEDKCLIGIAWLNYVQEKRGYQIPFLIDYEKNKRNNEKNKRDNEKNNENANEMKFDKGHIFHFNKQIQPKINEAIQHLENKNIHNINNNQQKNLKSIENHGNYRDVMISNEESSKNIIYLNEHEDESSKSIKSNENCKSRSNDNESRKKKHQYSSLSNSNSIDFINYQKKDTLSQWKPLHYPVIALQSYFRRTKRQFLQEMISSDRLETQYVLQYQSNVIDSFLYIVFFSFELRNLSGMRNMGSILIALYSLCTSLILHQNLPKIGNQVYDAQKELKVIEDSMKQFLLRDHSRIMEEKDSMEHWDHLVKKIRRKTQIFQARIWLYDVIKFLVTKYFIHTIMAICAGLPVFFGSLRKYQHSNDRSKFVSDLRFIAFLVPLLVNKWGSLLDNISSLRKIQKYIQQSKLDTFQNSDDNSKLFFTPIPDKQNDSNYYPKNKDTQSNSISFHNVDIINPYNRKCIIRRLSCKFADGGQHTLIQGPAGSGKTFLFQTICSLISHNGLIEKPKSPNIESMHKIIFYISDSIYIPEHKNWREQLIWPDQICECSDSYLEQLCTSNELTKEIYHSYTLDQVENWSTILNETDKLLLALCRLKYHCPKFVLFGNNALESLSNNEESELYKNLSRDGISIIRSISTHSSLVDPHLFDIHNYILLLDGSGGWQYSKLIQSSKGYSFFELAKASNLLVL